MSLKTKVALGVVAALALALAGTALAGRGHGGAARTMRMGAGIAGLAHHGGPADDLAAAASYLGVTSDALLAELQSGKTLAQVASATSGKSTAALIAALVAHEKQELADAVTAGKLTQAQADAMSASLEQRFTDLVNRTRPAGHGPGMGMRGGPSDHLDAAASYLGTTTSALLTQLQSGKTLAQVAAATSGKSTAGLIAALVAHEKQEWAAAVTAGKLTQAQVDAMSTTLEQRFTDFVNGTRPAGGMHGGWFGGHIRP